MLCSFTTSLKLYHLCSRSCPCDCYGPVALLTLQKNFTFYSSLTMDYLGCETSGSIVEPAVPVSTRPPKRARSPAAESETYKRPRDPISVAPKRINEALREEVSSSSIGSDPLLSKVVRDSRDWPVGVADPYDWTIQQLLYAVEADELSTGAFGSVNDSKNIKDDVTVRAFIRECSIDGQLLLTCVNDLALRNRNIKLESTRRALAIAIVHLRKHSPRYSQHCLDERQLENFDPCQLINNDLIYGPLTFQQRLKDCIMIVLDDMIADAAVFSKPKCWYFEIGCISVTKRNDKPFKFAYAVGHPLSDDAFNLDSSQNVFRCQSAAPVPHSDPMILGMFQGTKLSTHAFTNQGKPLGIPISSQILRRMAQHLVLPASSRRICHLHPPALTLRFQACPKHKAIDSGLLY